MTKKTDELLRNEYDYVLNYFKLVDFKGNEYDFTGHFVEFTFEESIFSSFVHGSVFVSDAVDYPTLLPMIGKERIKASFTRQNEKVEPGSDGELLSPITFDMPVYSMQGKRQVSGSGKLQTYTLQYTSDEIFNNLNNKIFKALKGKKYSEMVSLIYDSFLKKNKKLVVEESHIEVDYCIQNEHPIKAIDKIAKRTVPKNTGETEQTKGFFYVFYEDRDQFNFVTIGTLLQQAPVAKLTYEVKNIMQNTDGLSSKIKDFERDMYTVSNYQQQGTFDVLASAMSGEATSSLLTVDPILRKFNTKEFDLRKEFNQFPHIDKAKPWTDDHNMFIHPKANVAMLIGDSDHPTNEYIKEKDPTVKTYAPEEFLLHRQSQKKQLLKNVITTTLSGDPRIKAGQMVEFAIPEHLGKTSKENPEEKDKYLQGKYLVVAVSHMVKYGEYKMNLELVKDTFFSEIENRNPVEEYKDVY